MLADRFSNFYLRSGIFGVLSLIGALFNYALYPVLARLLNTGDFGDFTAILALSNQILAILLAFNVISIYLVKHNNEQTARKKAQVIQKLLVWFFIGATLLVAILSPFIRSHLKIHDPMAFVLLALILIIAVPTVVWTGYLQGHRRLVQVGLYAFSAALFKFILAIVLGSSFGTVGALWGVLLGTLAALLVLQLCAGIKLPSLGSVLSPLKKDEKIILKTLVFYVSASILVVGGLGFLQNIDITFAKGLFDSQTAGVYSGISILSNAVYYVAFLLIWIILPEIDLRNKTVNRRVLGTAYKLLGLLAAGALIIEVVFRNVITKKLLGAAFANQGQILIYATLFQISLVAVTLYALYLLILRSLRSLILSLSVILCCVVLPWLFGDTPRHMILSLWLAVLLGSGLYLFINSLHRLTRQSKLKS